MIGVIRATEVVLFGKLGENEVWEQSIYGKFIMRLRCKKDLTGFICSSIILHLTAKWIHFKTEWIHFKTEWIHFKPKWIHFKPKWIHFKPKRRLSKPKWRHSKPKWSLVKLAGIWLNLFENLLIVESTHYSFHRSKLPIVHPDQQKQIFLEIA